MSSKKAYLTLRLSGPMQSWGSDSRFSRRNTGLMPSKSAIAGICCAALGYDRGSEKERAFLEEFVSVEMIAIRLPKKKRSGECLSVRRLVDYHTIQDTKKANGETKASHITYRQYLTDADLGVVLAGCASLLEITASALKDPVWGIWLGRKSCIPTLPVFVALKDSREKALTSLIGDMSLDRFTCQKQVEIFAKGKDTLMDNPLSFALDNRRFLPRRVVTIQEKQEETS